MWTTGAKTAAYGLLLARTDWDVPKHRGLTYFVLPMQQDGVDVRPIKQMNLHASFNEVFISDARIPRRQRRRRGRVTAGASRSRPSRYERAGIGRIFTPASAESQGRTAREAAEEAAAYLKTYVWYPQRMGRPDLVIPHAKAAGKTDDTRIRQRIAVHPDARRASRSGRSNAHAPRARRATPGPEGSIGKLADVAHRAGVCGGARARSAARR